MARLARADLQSLINVLGVALSALDEEMFPSNVLVALRSLVEYDVAIFLTIDATSNRIWSWAQEPSHLVFPHMEHLFQGHLADHPLLLHCIRTGSGTVVRMSDFLSPAQFRAHPIYRDFYARLGMRHQLGFGIAQQPSLVAWTEMLRADRDFTERDRAVVQAMLPHLRLQWQWSRSVAALSERGSLLNQAAQHLRVGLVAVDAERRVHYVSQRAGELLTAYLDTEQEVRGRLPQALDEWIARERIVESGPIRSGPEPFIIARDGSELWCRVVAGRTRWLITLEEQSLPSRRTSLEDFGLTRREAEVVQVLVTGMSNGDIATILKMSERTVGKHLEHIYAKLGVSGRAAVMARALGLLRHK